MDLNDEFQKYVGQLVKDPQRLTTDTDPVADQIAQEAAQNGLLLHFMKAGVREEPFMADVAAVHVLITQDGVAQNQPGAWRVDYIRCDPK